MSFLLDKMMLAYSKDHSSPETMRFKQHMSVWKLTDILLNNIWIKKKIVKYLELNSNEHATCHTHTSACKNLVKTELRSVV